LGLKPAWATPIPRPPAPANSSTLLNIRGTRADKFYQSFLQGASVSNPTFPDHQNLPAHFGQTALVLDIPLAVSLKLRHPEILAGFRQSRQLTGGDGMSVPEAAMDIYCLTSSTEHNIWFARQIPRVQAIAITETVQKPANDHFRFGVLAPHPGHALATFLGGERVHRGVSRDPPATRKSRRRSRAGCPPE